MEDLAEIKERARAAGLNKDELEDFLLHMKDAGITDFDECMESWRHFQSSHENSRIVRGFYVGVFIIMSVVALLLLPIVLIDTLGISESISVPTSIIFAMGLFILGVYLEITQPFSTTLKQKSTGASARAMAMFSLITIAGILFIVLLTMIGEPLLRFLTALLEIIKDPVIALISLKNWFEYSMWPIIIMILGFGIPVLIYLGIKKLLFGKYKRE